MIGMLSNFGTVVAGVAVFFLGCGLYVDARKRGVR